MGREAKPGQIICLSGDLGVGKTVFTQGFAAGPVSYTHLDVYKRQIEVLTGFKYIGEKIQEFHEKGSHTFIFGFEESFGCLTGTDVYKRQV